MSRIMTLKGLRTMAPITSLPRETKAAALTMQEAQKMSDRLVRAGTPEQVEDVLSEAFAQSVMQMGIKRDPHCSMWSYAYYLIDSVQATTPQSFDFFFSQTVGTAANGVPGVRHNLLDDRKPLKPVLIHNVGIFAVCFSDAEGLELVTLAPAEIKLQRDKDSIFEFPLISALLGYAHIDLAGAAFPTIDLEPLAVGGVELEGHGAPFLLDEAISLKVDFPMGGTFPQQTTVATGKVLLIARIDGEAMEV